MSDRFRLESLIDLRRNMHPKGKVVVKQRQHLSQGSVMALHPLPYNKFLSIYSDGTISCWHPYIQKPLFTFKGNPKSYFKFIWNIKVINPQHILISSDDTSIRLWQIPHGHCLQRLHN